MDGERQGLTFVVLVRRLIDNRAVLEAAQIEHPDAAVGTAADEDIDTTGAEPDIVYFLVVRDQLRLGGQCRNIPDGAGRVDAGGDDQTRGNRVPIE